MFWHLLSSTLRPKTPHQVTTKNPVMPYHSQGYLEKPWELKYSKTTKTATTTICSSVLGELPQVEGSTIIFSHVLVTVTTDVKIKIHTVNYYNLLPCFRGAVRRTEG